MISNYSIPLAAGFAFAGALLAQAPPATNDLARAFPSDSWAYAACAGMDAGTATFQTAKLVGVVRDLLATEGWQRLEAMARERSGPNLAEAPRFLAHIGVSASELRQLLAGPFALGVGRMTLHGAGMPSVAVVAAVGERAGARSAIAAVERVLSADLPQPLPKSATEIDGMAFTAFDLPHGLGQLVHGIHDGHWFLSNSRGYVADCLRALRGQRESLAKVVGLSSSRAQLPGQRMLELFVNAQPFEGLVAGVMPYEAAELGRALGVTGMPGLFVACAHDGKSAHDVVELTLPGPREGLLKAPFQRVRHHAAQWVKPETTLFASIALDAPGAVQALQRFVEALPPAAQKEVRRNLDRELGHALRHRLQMSPEEAMQILRAFGPEVSLAIDLPKMMPPFVNVAAFVELPDAAHAHALVERLVARAPEGNVQLEDNDGIKTWSTEVQSTGMRMTPSIGIRDNWMVISNFKHVVKRHLRAGPLGVKSLAADPRFQAACKSAPDSAVFITGRLQPILDAYWGIAAAGLEGQINKLGVEPKTVPDAETMTDALDDIVIAGQVTERGLRLSLQQPFGFGTVVPALASALDWLLGTPALARGDAPAPRAGARVMRIY